MDVIKVVHTGSFIHHRFLDEAGDTTFYGKKVQIALCKETLQVWKAVGLEGKGLHCNCTG